MKLFNFFLFLVILASLLLIRTGEQYAQQNDFFPDSTQFNVVPNAYSSTQGTGSFLGPLANSQRTYQFLINESQLTSLVGKSLTGITYRLLASASANWPASSVTFTNFDIYLSGSVAPADRSLTFAQNIVGTQKQVRSGSLTIEAGSFLFGGSPTQFGTTIAFDSAYTYTGGHLLVELRHTGFTGTSASTDAILTSTTGYGSLFSACWIGSYTGTTGNQGNFVVLRISAESPVSTGNGTVIPKDYNLSQNYPNPFNPSTAIKFALPKESNVKIVIYDVFGREVETLINGKYNPGEYEIQWNASQHASGVYFCKMITETSVEIKKMTLVK